ncbi:MAG: neutral/alkaline non-lysosomal ceramidase N-terminal domain-containing protein [Clostridiales bacterium]|nr:neutral/alkaline non-lysosomal ceramidase N-terminal domain-containing protein [Clostridiales bacterium]
MKAILGNVKITPAIGTPMGGNVRKDNKVRGVHDDLYCNIIILYDGNKKICLMGYDVVGLKYKTCTSMKKVISTNTDIRFENIIMFATHTHSGPDTCMRMYQGIEETIDTYLDKIEKRILQEIIKLNQQVYQEVTLTTGKTLIHDLSFNRRLIRKNGDVVMNFEQFSIDDIVGTTGPIDPELLTLGMWNESKKLIGILVNFTLHPAILVGLDWLISRDYIDNFDRQLKKHYGDHLVVLFANGAEGNINHLNYEKKDQWRDFRETDRIGKKLAEYTKNNIEKAVEVTGDIKFVSKIAKLPLRPIKKEEIEWANMVMIRDKDKEEDMFDGIPDKTYAKMVLAMDKRTETTYETVIQGMFMDNFAFVTFPGEVYVEFGLAVKKATTQENTMIIGIANSQSGYIPKEEAFSQGGYEVRTAWSSQLIYKAGDFLVDYIKKEIIGE